ncbi:MAG: DUF4186 domain-containing protein [Lentisphaeria bacterium]|nr:DUF4186 domain-containing protein [Lentisphaeria bacterium]
MPSSAENQSDWEQLKERLSKSKFRSRFRLKEPELKIIAERGMDEVAFQCRQFLQTRLAPAFPPNDGKQTPMRGHPCFIAQHATGICCRGCLQKWHGIPSGRELTEEELDTLTNILMCWIREHSSGAENIPHTPNLF